MRRSLSPRKALFSCSNLFDIVFFLTLRENKRKKITKEVMYRERVPARFCLAHWILHYNETYQRDWWKVSPLLPFKYEPGFSDFNDTLHTGRLCLIV